MPFSSVQFSRSVKSDSLQPHGLPHARPPCPSPTPGAYTNSCHPTISSSVDPSPPTFNLSQHQGLFQWVSSSHPVAKVLKFQLQHQSFQWTPRSHLLLVYSKVIQLYICILLLVLFSIIGFYRILQGEGNGNPLQYSCLENPMDEGPGRLQSMGSLGVGYDWSDLAAAAAGYYR